MPGIVLCPEDCYLGRRVRLIGPAAFDPIRDAGYADRFFSEPWSLTEFTGVITAIVAGMGNKPMFTVRIKGTVRPWIRTIAPSNVELIYDNQG